MRSLPLSLLALSLSTLVGCKAIDAMNNTDTMKADLAAMKQTTGGMAGTTEGMNNTTKELERKASIGAGLQLIQDPANTREFTPPQANMLAGAKLIAENMNSDELIQFLYAKLKELNKTVPDESQFDRRRLGGYSAEYVAQFNRAKQVQAVILQAVAAQIPQAMVEKLIAEQIDGGGGRFSDTAYTTLMLRAMFINSFYLDAGVFSTTMDTMGKVREANNYLNRLQFVANLPYADKIQLTVEGTAFLPVVNPAQIQLSDADYLSKCANTPTPDAACSPTLGEAPNINAALDVSIAKPWWKKLVKKIDREMPDNLRDGNSPYAREIAEIRENAVRIGADGK